MRKLLVRGVRYDVKSLLVWSAAVSACGFLLISAFFDPASVRWSWTQASIEGWLAVIHLAWGANLLAYWLWTTLLARHPARHSVSACRSSASWPGSDCSVNR